MFDIDDSVYQRANVEGWLTDREGKLLYLLAKDCNADIIEIGSWKGRSTIFLALGSLAGNMVPVHAIDRFTGSSEHRATMGEINTYNEFCANLEKANVREIVSICNGESSEFVNEFNDGSIELLFIDGSHEYDSVEHDFEMYFPKMKSGGVVAFHDYGTPGPTQAVVLNMPKFSESGRVDDLAVCRVK